MWGVGKTQNQGRRSLLSIVKFALGWPLSIAALFFVARIILSQQKNIVFKIEEPNVILLLSGIICFFLFYLTRSFVWKLILKELGHNIPLKTVSYLWEISELRRFVPGNIWSFLGRASLFSNVNVPTKTIVRALIIETECFLLACFTISILGALFYSNSLLNNMLYAFLVPLLLILLLATLLFIKSSLLTKYLKGRFLSKIVLLFPQFSPYRNVLILGISIFYLFLFGLGTYLTITSITFISPTFTLSLSAFFVFSLLVGYLSIITPMGLGVRESAMIVGLSQFVTLGLAGVASIFARIVLIISELLFLLFTYLWKRTKNKIVTFLDNFITIHKHEVILGILIAIYLVYFTSASMLRYDNFYAGRFDLGNMTQTVWNTINGRIFVLTDPNGIEIISRLAFHADFILILLSPFYLLWENPKMLLLVQTAVLAVGSIFVYAIGNNVIKNKNLSLTFGASFLLNPAVHYTNLYDFHPVTLATTFLLGAFYFLSKKRYLLFLLLVLLAAFTKEQVWIIAAFFGAYLFFLRKQILGLCVFMASIGIFYFLIWHAMPSAKGSEHFALSYYSDFGDSPTSIVKNVLLSPQKTLTIFFQKDQLSYLNQLFFPVGFLSFLSPLYLIFALPDLLINLLSNNSNLHQIYYQYSATITPFIFISTIFTVKNIQKWFPKIPSSFFIFYLTFFTLLSAYAFGPLPGGKNPNIAMFTKPQKERKLINDFLNSINSSYSIAATNNIGSHLSHRQKIFTIPVTDKADYVLFLLNDSYAQPSLKFQKDLANRVKYDKNYIEVFRKGDFVAFKKRTFP